MNFEKLEQRYVFDGASFCTPIEIPAPVTLQQIEYTEHIVYGPAMPPESLVAEQEASVANDSSFPTPQVDYDGPVTVVPELIINGVLESKQDVPTSTGLRAALDILEASGGYIQEWLDNGITQIYNAGDEYYFEFETPLDHLLTLGKRSLSVNISDGTVHGFSMW